MFEQAHIHLPMDLDIQWHHSPSLAAKKKNPVGTLHSVTEAQLHSFQLCEGVKPSALCLSVPVS